MVRRPMRPDKPVLDKREWEVVATTYAACRFLVEREHYSKSLTSIATHCHGLVRRGRHGAIHGAAVWNVPLLNAAKNAWDGPVEEVLHLSRLVVSPAVPQNGATFLIAASVRLIRREGRYRCLISFADHGQHTGTIYRAGNWEYCGETDPEPRWVDAEGKMVSRRGASPADQSQEAMLRLGYRIAGRFTKSKWRIILPESRNARGAIQGELWHDHE